MKTFAFLLFFIIAIPAKAQDTAFLNTLNAIPSQDSAKDVAASLASRLKGNYVFYKLKEFDNGMLRIVFTPQGMTEDAIKAQADYEDSFVTDFKTVTDANGKSYRFDKAKAKFDALFPVWQYYFKADAKPDKKTQRYTNAENTMLFSFLNLGDVWAIGR
ncbi:hypothetical protein ACX0HA_04950 [Flavobacterium hauense]